MFGAPVRPGRISADERSGRGERHLETRADDLVRRKHDDDDCRDGEVAQRQRRPVEKYGSEHHGEHDEAALRGDLGTGNEEVAGEPDDREDSRVFLHGMTGREIREEREAGAQQAHDGAGDQRHVQAGDRDDVVDAGAAQRLVHVLRDARADADHERGGDLALGPVDTASNAVGDGVARTLDRGAEKRDRRRRAGGRGEFRTAQEKATGADAVEIALEGEVVTIRPDRAGRRHEPDEPCHRRPCPDAIRDAPRRDADAVRRIAQHRPLGAGDVDGQPHAAVGEMLDLGYAAGKLCRHLAAEHFCAGAPGLCLGKQRADYAEQHGDKRHMQSGSRAGSERQQAKDKRAGEKRRKTGLAAERKIDQRPDRQDYRSEDEGDAAIEFGRDRQPDGAGGRCAGQQNGLVPPESQRTGPPDGKPAARQPIVWNRYLALMNGRRRGERLSVLR